MNRDWRQEADVWWQALLELVFPARCPGCGAAVAAPDAWCSHCLHELWDPRRLDVCGRGMRHIEACQVLTGYRKEVRTLLHGLKFQRRRRDAAPLVWLLSRADGLELSGLPLPDCVVVPVPLAAGRRAERGYNQVELIFADWCRAQGADWETDALVRLHPTAPQWELSRRDRAENMKGAFLVNAPEIIRNRRILVVDDIVTTGRTMEECAIALKRAGAESVHALALAGGQPGAG